MFLASEPVYEWQTAIISSVLQPAAMVAHYGAAERTVLGAWCELARTYHFLPLYGYFETGSAGEMTGTGCTNRATPFVRYNSSDVALGVSETPCAVCGCSYTPVVEHIDGRLEDYLVDEKDELIPPAVVTFPFKNLRAIESVRIVQDERRNVLLRCVARAAPEADLEADGRALMSGMHKLLGPSIAVRFEYVDEIPLTEAGKFRWIISRAEKVVASMGAR